MRFPALGEVVYARQGGGCWRQLREAPPQRVTVRQSVKLSDAVLCFTDVDGWAKTGRIEIFNTLCANVRLARGWGDCYGHVLVATGGADVMVDPLLNPWDAAALVPIITEAGGRFVDWTGVATIDGGNGLSTVPGLLDEVLSLLRPSSKRPARFGPAASRRASLTPKTTGHPVG
ncbi:MAG: inositol monophosphatase family protein [Planctomycetaceae bacterium]